MDCNEEQSESCVIFLEKHGDGFVRYNGGCSSSSCKAVAAVGNLSSLLKLQEYHQKFKTGNIQEVKFKCCEKSQCNYKIDGVLKIEDPPTKEDEADDVRPVVRECQTHTPFLSQGEYSLGETKDCPSERSKSCVAFVEKHKDDGFERFNSGCSHETCTLFAERMKKAYGEGKLEHVSFRCCEEDNCNTDVQQCWAYVKSKLKKLSK